MTGVPADDRHEIPSGSAWRRAMRALSPADRRLIQRTVRRGEALDDPRLAALGVEAARRQQVIAVRSPKRARLVERGVAAFAALIGVYNLLVFALDADGDVVDLLVGLFWLLVFVPVFAIYQPRVRARAERAERLNREVVERASASGPPPAP